MLLDNKDLTGKWVHIINTTIIQDRAGGKGLPGRGGLDEAVKNRQDLERKEGFPGCGRK